MNTPFRELSEYVALPRVGALHAAPDGSRLVASVATLDAKRTGYTTSLWQVDPEGATPAFRLTRGARGEKMADFTPGGDLLFIAKRPSGEDDADTPASMWMLPASGGEPRVVATHPGGFTGVWVRGDAVVALAPTMPGSVTVSDDEKLRKVRKEQKVDAILHSSYPIRHWDADIGPDSPRLYAASLSELSVAEPGGEEPQLVWRDLTPDAAGALDRCELDVAPDGGFVVSTWRVVGARADQRTQLVRIDVATGERTVLADEPEVDFSVPVVSPDGSSVAFVRTPKSTAAEVTDSELWLMDSDGAGSRRIAESWDRWPHEIRWLPDSSGLVVSADEGGETPLFAVPLGGASPVRLTGEGAFTDLFVAPDGSRVFALRAAIAYPAEPVSVSLDGWADGRFAAGRAEVVALPAPGMRPKLPGRVENVSAVTPDGASVRGWLCLPAGASQENPAPLLLWVHGGPVMSWNAWSWRWNPWLMVERGYAVLLPDPALSTGYGRDFVQRGWGRWGAEPYTDLMAITDAVEGRPDIDETRTAAMGGSFGGYMANWIAGQTDRFRAIVTHASLWALEGFGRTTDHAYFWERELSPEFAEQFSPHRFVDRIVTPMLVIHGDRDYRVPIGEGLRLWFDLLNASGTPMDDDGETKHRFLYFPTENHWILTPQHAEVWYEVVLGFLAEHVLGQPSVRTPEALGLTRPAGDAVCSR